MPCASFSNADTGGICLTVKPFSPFSADENCMWKNYQKILTYEPCCIRILTRKGRVRIEGSRLTIAYYSGEEMKITGQMQTITFES